MMKYHTIKECVKETHNDTQHQNSAHPKTGPIDCDVMQLICVFVCVCLNLQKVFIVFIG